MIVWLQLSPGPVTVANNTTNLLQCLNTGNSYLHQYWLIAVWGLLAILHAQNTGRTDSVSPACQTRVSLSEFESSRNYPKVHQAGAVIGHSCLPSTCLPD